MKKLTVSLLHDLGAALRAALNEHLDAPAELRLVGGEGLLLHEPCKSLEAPLDDLMGSGVLDLGGGGAGAPRVDEGVGKREAHLPHERERVLEVLLLLTGKPHDDVGRKCDAAYNAHAHARQRSADAEDTEKSAQRPGRYERVQGKVLSMRRIIVKRLHAPSG